MCVDEFGLSFSAGEKFLTRKSDLCIRGLSLNRGLVCHVLNTLASNSQKVLNCLDANTPCGFMGMLWRKYIDQNINVEINGLWAHSPNIINANLSSNKLKAAVVGEDPCVRLRRHAYDFIFLNCKTSASLYLDSLFSKVQGGAVVALTTSDDPSLHWQSPDLALKNYGGVIVRTSYIRELGIRLVIAEMARSAARYNKGITVLCSTCYKTQQSFTIVVRVDAKPAAARKSLENIKRLLHCTVCEDRAFVPNSKFPLQSPESLLSCDCSKNKEAKTVNELGPIWSGDIFSVKFIESMMSKSKGFPWESKILLLLMQILEEAKCGDKQQDEEPSEKKTKMEDEDDEETQTEAKGQPSFYFNTHKHRPSSHQLPKVVSIVHILRKAGFRASRTHFDPGAVRTNATLREYLELLKGC